MAKTPKTKALKRTTVVNFIIFLALVAVVAVATGYYFYQKNRYEDSAEMAVHKIEQAIEIHNAAAFQANVDVLGLSQNLVTQIFTSADGQKEGDLLDKITNSVSSKVTSFIKPMLAKNLSTQMLEYVTTGQMGEPGEDNMLSSLWADIGRGEEYFKYIGVSKANQVDEFATVYVDFQRLDLEKTYQLAVGLKRVDDDWKVINIANFGTVLRQIKKDYRDLVAQANHELKNEMSRILKVQDFQKSSGVSQWGVGKGILLRIAFHNTGEKDIKSFRATVRFVDSDGSVLKDVPIKDTDVLPAGEVAEKSWPVSINPLDSGDKAVYELPEENLNALVIPQSVTFADGTNISLMELPE